jgi:hypothetical protein
MRRYASAKSHEQTRRGASIPARFFQEEPMKIFTLEITFDEVDQEKFTSIINDFRYDYFEYGYVRGVMPPNRMRFTFRNLREGAVDILKNKFRAYGLDNGRFTTTETYG